MIADFFTKPLQDELFNMFRDVIMGIVHHNTLVTPVPKNQKRVGE